MLFSFAHTVLPGSGDLANGLLDPIFTPAHLMLLFGLGLWLGQRQPLVLLRPVLAFMIPATIGFGLNFAPANPLPLRPVIAALALVAGGLVAMEARGSRWLDLGVFALSGAAIALDSRPEATSLQSALTLSIGTWISLAVLLVNIAFYVSLLPQKQWIRIGLRIAGSWLFAISLLLVAFALRR